jgi:hypothetical protein
VLTAGGVTAPGTYLVNANFSFFGSSGLVFDFGVSKNNGDPINLIGGRKISKKGFKKLLAQIEKDESGSHWMGEKLIRTIKYI